MAEIKVDGGDLATTGTQVAAKAREFIDAVNTADKKIKGAKWDSPAARKYRQDWSEVKHAADKLHTAIESFGKAAKDMAKNYEDADKAYKGTS